MLKGYNSNRILEAEKQMGALNDFLAELRKLQPK